MVVGVKISGHGLFRSLPSGLNGWRGHLPFHFVTKLVQRNVGVRYLYGAAFQVTTFSDEGSDLGSSSNILSPAHYAFVLFHHRVIWLLPRCSHMPVKSGVWLQLLALPALWHRIAKRFCHHSSAPFSTEKGWIRFVICLWQAQTRTVEHTCQPGDPEAYLSYQIIHFCPNWHPLYSI